MRTSARRRSESFVEMHGKHIEHLLLRSDTALEHMLTGNCYSFKLVLHLLEACNILTSYTQNRSRRRSRDETIFEVQVLV
jgi:hypothetical protein